LPPLCATTFLDFPCHPRHFRLPKIISSTLNYYDGAGIAPESLQQITPRPGQKKDPGKGAKNKRERISIWCFPFHVSRLSSFLGQRRVYGQF